MTCTVIQLRPHRIAARCHPRCGAVYTAEQWSRLRFVGEQPDGAGGVLELRACARCDSTRATPLARPVAGSARRRRRALWVAAAVTAAISGFALWGAIAC